MSLENPYSQYYSVIFQITDKITNSKVVMINETYYQEQVTESFSEEEVNHILFKFADQKYKGSLNFRSDEIDVVATTFSYSLKETERLMREDLVTVVFVVVVVFLYFCWYLGSIFLAVSSVINIVMSIPITLIIYYYVFKVLYFGSIHLSAFIIIIGIGADDIFVFHDFWLTTFQIKAFENKPTLRLTFAFRQASRAMMVTSLTSSIAFLSCAMTPIMPLRAFGYFASILVPICFLVTVLV